MSGYVRRVVNRAEQVRRLRVSLGLTQEAFASLIGTTFVSVNRWEGEHSQPLNIWAALLDLLERAIAKAGAEPVRNELRAAAGDMSAVLLSLGRMANA